jgi:hypothetical protein
VGILYIMALESKIHDGGKCYVDDWNEYEDIKQLYEEYTKYRVIVGICIVGGLISTSIASIRLLKKFF